MYDIADYWAAAWRASSILITISLVGAVAFYTGDRKGFQRGLQVGAQAGFQQGLMQCPRAQKGTYDFDNASMDTGHTSTQGSSDSTH